MIPTKFSQESCFLSQSATLQIQQLSLLQLAVIILYSNQIIYENFLRTQLHILIQQHGDSTHSKQNQTSTTIPSLQFKQMCSLHSLILFYMVLQREFANFTHGLHFEILWSTTAKKVILLLQVIHLLQVKIIAPSK